MDFRGTGPAGSGVIRVPGPGDRVWCEEMLMKCFQSRALVGVVCLSVCLLAGCSGDEAGNVEVIPETPAEAAVQVDQVFKSAPVEVQQAAQVAAEGLRDGDYEQAVLSLQAVKASGSLTMDQGMAVHNSMVALEAELIAAKQAGDPQAAQDYERLKQMKRR